MLSICTHRNKPHNRNVTYVFILRYIFFSYSNFSELKWTLKVKVAQSYLILCNPMEFSIEPHGILQARILEYVAFPFSRGSSQPRDRTQVSHNAGRFFTIWATREAKWTLNSVICKSQLVEVTQESITYESINQMWYYIHTRDSLTAQLVKNPPAIQEILVWFLGWKDPLEKG